MIILVVVLLNSLDFYFQLFEKVRFKNFEVFVTVELKGEVKHPGTYQVRKGEKLSVLIWRAGGLRDGAKLSHFAFSTLIEKSGPLIVDQAYIRQQHGGKSRQLRY